MVDNVFVDVGDCGYDGGRGGGRRRRWVKGFISETPVVVHDTMSKNVSVPQRQK